MLQSYDAQCASLVALLEFFLAGWNCFLAGWSFYLVVSRGRKGTASLLSNIALFPMPSNVFLLLFFVSGCRGVKLGERCRVVVKSVHNSDLMMC